MVVASGTASPSATLSLISILVLGFVLGMRHATDADHVVAVSTIVSRERRIRSAAWIGALWGAGHTITIFAVGVGIIVFTLVIPPRVGLSMEFSVGVMLCAAMRSPICNDSMGSTAFGVRRSRSMIASSSCLLA